MAILFHASSPFTNVILSVGFYLVLISSIVIHQVRYQTCLLSLLSLFAQAIIFPSSFDYDESNDTHDSVLFCSFLQGENTEKPQGG